MYTYFDIYIYIYIYIYIHMHVGLLVSQMAAAQVVDRCLASLRALLSI